MALIDVPVVLTELIEGEDINEAMATLADVTPSVLRWIESTSADSSRRKANTSDSGDADMVRGEAALSMVVVSEASSSAGMVAGFLNCDGRSGTGSGMIEEELEPFFLARTLPLNIPLSEATEKRFSSFGSRDRTSPSVAGRELALTGDERSEGAETGAAVRETEVETVVERFRPEMVAADRSAGGGEGSAMPEEGGVYRGGAGVGR